MSRRKQTFGGVTNWCSMHEGFVFCFVSIVVLVLAIILAYSVERIGLKGIVFGKESGFYENDLEVEIKRDGVFATGGVIKYNMNGDDLSSTNQEYKESIELRVPEYGYKLYTITAAVCYAENDCMEPKVATYVLGKDLDSDITLDIVNINSSQKNLYDYETGIMIPGKKYDENVSEDYPAAGNYSERTKEWIRDSFVTIIDADGNVKTGQRVGLAISGGASVVEEKKSFKIVSEKGKGHALIPFSFDEEKLYESIRFRSGGQDQRSGNIRSSVASRLVRMSGFDGINDTKRVMLFLNGDFYGIFDAQQNYSETFISDYYGVNEKKNIEKARGHEDWVLDYYGLGSAFDDLTKKQNRDTLEGIIDMEEFLRYYALQIMLNNTDWPMNNYEAWRVITPEVGDNGMMDGRIRFLMYDMDAIYYAKENYSFFDSITSDVFENLMDNKYRAYGSVFRSVMKADVYKNRFIEILREYINGSFKTENVLSVIDEEATKIDHQMELFYSGEEYEEWKGWIDLMRRTAAKREGEVRADVKKYFGVDL